MEEIWKQFDEIRSVEAEVVNDNICINCGSENLAEDKIGGDIICIECGCVKEERIIDDKAEWNYGQEESMFSKDPSRCGGPMNPLLEKSSLSTIVVNADYRNHGNLKRLHQQQSMDYIERSRYHIFEDITKMASDNGKLPSSIVEQAKYYYKELSQKRLSRGKIRKGLIACCILHSCKMNKVTRSVKEISNMCYIDTITINKCLKIFKDVMNDECEGKYSESTGVSDLYCRKLNRLQLTKQNEIKLKKRINYVSQKVDELCMLNGKTPTAITAAIIYYSATTVEPPIKINKKEIIEINNVSSVTLNKIINILEENHEKLVK